MFSGKANQPVEVEFTASGVCVLESRHTRAFRMEDVAHDFGKVLYVFEGEGWLVLGAKRLPLRRGDVAWVPAGARHRITDETPLSLYAVCVRADVLGQAGEIPGESGSARVFHAAPWSAEARGLIRLLLVEQSWAQPGCVALVRGYTWQLLGRVWRAAARGPRPRTPKESGAAPGVARARVVAYARELAGTFSRRESIDDAAASVGLSRRRFTQLFREVAGDSWLSTVRRHRVAQARRLLAETERSVASVGFECGFEDLSGFYRAFRAAERMSPQAWRAARLRRPTVFGRLSARGAGRA